MLQVLNLATLVSIESEMGETTKYFEFGLQYPFQPLNTVPLNLEHVQFIQQYFD